MNRNLLLVCLLLTGVACSSTIEKLPFYNTPDFTPEFISPDEAKTKINHQIADFSFTNQYAKKITQADIEGKVHVANFIFTSCGSICPVMTRNLKTVDAAFANNSKVVLLSYSVTPWIDSVPRLQMFAKNYKITNPNWHLLTGNKAVIYDLARKSYFAEESLGYTKDSTEFLHTEHMLLIDKNKKIRGIYNGTLQLEMKNLIRDISILLREAD